MNYYIQVGTILSHFRLQKDQSWRLLNSNDFLESDYFTDDIYDTIRFQDRIIKIEHEGKILSTQTEDNSYSRLDSLDFNITVERIHAPFIPSLDQLVSTIKHGNDNISNCLILNLSGYFELRNHELIELDVADPSIVFRFETFSAGNEYVGENAGSDIHHVELLYVTALTFWLEHLKYGTSNYYSDEYEKLDSLPALLKEVEAKSQEIGASDEYFD